MASKTKDFLIMDDVLPAAIKMDTCDAEEAARQKMRKVISAELLLMCCGYFVGHIVLGSQRYIVYPLLIASIVANFLITKNVHIFAERRDFQKVLLIALALMICAGCSILYQQRTGFEETIAQFGFIALGVIFACQIARWFSFTWLLWWGYVALVLFLSAYALSVPQSVIRGELFSETNSNALSAELLWLLQFIYIGIARENKRMPLIIYLAPAILTLFLCLLVGGRSGVLFSAMLLIGVVLNFKNGRLLSLKRIVFVLSIIVAAIILVQNINIFQDTAIYQNFLTGGLDSDGRSSIAEQYFHELSNPLNIIFGVDLSQLPSIDFLKHPHNSYILLHSYTGLFGFLLVVILLCKGMLRISEGKIGMLLIVLSFPLRIVTDSICFFSNLDFVIYLLCISAFFDESVVLPKPHSKTGGLLRRV